MKERLLGGADAFLHFLSERNKVEKTDIHCHILPDMDDGAKSEEESLELLRLAFGQGISKVIATPHASEAFPKSRPDVIKKKCELLEKRARQVIHPEYRIYPGQEILFTESVSEKLDRGELLTLAGSSYILIEFHPSTPYQVLYRAVREFAMTPYHPVLAHMERYEALREEGRVEELIQAGTYMQMNYHPIGGRWYDRTARWCRRMLEAGNVHLLGTDMHRVETRPPQTDGAMHWMAAHLDSEELEDMCFRNAERILKDIRI